MSLQHPIMHQTLSHKDLITLIETALLTGEARYARQIALAWLGNFPGDLPINLLHARSLVQEGLLRQALPILEMIGRVDPEYLAAQQLIATIKQRMGGVEDPTNAACILALGGKSIPSTTLPKWAPLLRSARKTLGEMQLSPGIAEPSSGAKNLLEKGAQAESLVHQALAENPSNPLTAVYHLRVVLQQNILPAEAVRSLARVYHERWPDCLAFTIVLADALMDVGVQEQAVELLHQAVAKDITAQVIQRLFGKEHPYQNLWPNEIEIQPNTPSSPQNIPIPSKVAAAFGWNQLPAPGSKTMPDKAVATRPCISFQEQAISDPNAPTQAMPTQAMPTQAHLTKPSSSRLPANAGEINSIQEEFVRIAARLGKPELGRMDGRYPVYVIFTSWKGLEQQYGSEKARLVDQELRQLVGLVAKRPRWNAMLLYADLAEIFPVNPKLALQKAKANDPWALKLSLADLDSMLSKQGEMIGAVLIVGGPQVIPFHHLPNPVDDLDTDVPSDNPYATRDENYFIPEWPVGRLPDGTSSDPGFLIQALKRIQAQHSTSSPNWPWYRQWLHALRQITTRLFQSKQTLQPGLGYSAAIWQQSSRSVYRVIGKPNELLISPPLQIASMGTEKRGKQRVKSCLHLPEARLAYFNLHGLSDSTAWYGQRDPADAGTDPDFPIALRPEDVASNGNKPPEIVFSEACYGALISDRTVEQAIALKFLSQGTHAMIGSTCTSYGTVTPPLSAADLLGRAYWLFLQQGYPVGEALRRAKIHLARETHRQQSYLSGEDQKTLISFVLYGDPLAHYSHNSPGPKTILRPLTRPELAQTITGRDSADQQLNPEFAPVPPDVLTQVREVVHKYLPGMEDAQLSYTRESIVSQANHSNSSKNGHVHPGKKNTSHPYPGKRVITLSKTIEQSVLIHHQFARLTLDDKGELYRLVVSR